MELEYRIIYRNRYRSNNIIRLFHEITTQIRQFPGKIALFG
jgi:hypothetical protein